MKFLRIVFLLLIINIAVKAQVGIGTQTPNASAQLDISSTNKGLLIPRLTKVERNAITSPATGLMIFQTDSISGFYYYNGANWDTISNPTSGDNLGNHAADQNINLNGKWLSGNGNDKGLKIDSNGLVSNNGVREALNFYEDDLGPGTLNLRADSTFGESIALRIMGNNNTDYYSGGKIVFGDYTVPTDPTDNGYGIYMEEESDENFIIKAKNGKIKIAADDDILLLANRAIKIGSLDQANNYTLPTAGGNAGDALILNEDGDANWQSLPSTSGGTTLQAGQGLSIIGTTISIDNSVVTSDNSGDVHLTGKMISGNVTYPNVAGISGKVLTIGDNGIASWQDAPITTFNAGTGININGSTLSVDNSVVTKDNSSNVTISGKLSSGTITYPNADGTAGQVLKTNGAGVLGWTSLNSSTRLVGVPSSILGTFGDKKGDVATDGNYLYYCIQDFGGVSYQVKFSRSYSGRYPAITKGNYPSPVTGWKLIYAGNEYTIQNALGELGPNEWYFFVDRDITTTNGDDAILLEPSTTNIWKRIAWGSDTW